MVTLTAARDCCRLRQSRTSFSRLRASSSFAGGVLDLLRSRLGEVHLGLGEEVEDRQLLLLEVLDHRPLFLLGQRPANSRSWRKNSSTLRLPEL